MWECALVLWVHCDEHLVLGSYENWRKDVQVHGDGQKAMLIVEGFIRKSVEEPPIIIGKR